MALEDRKIQGRVQGSNVVRYSACEETLFLNLGWESEVAIDKHKGPFMHDELGRKIRGETKGTFVRWSRT